MSLESYFDFLAQDDVRLKGTRVGIETVLEDYLNGASPEEIGARYRSVTLEQGAGVFRGRSIEQLYLLWIASEAEEYLDRLLYLPM